MLYNLCRFACETMFLVPTIYIFCFNYSYDSYGIDGTFVDETK
jgi:hypothetical protein